MTTTPSTSAQSDIFNVAEPHLKQLLAYIERHFVEDGWTCPQSVQRVWADAFVSDDPCISYALEVTSPGLADDDDVLTVYAGFASGHETLTGTEHHEFGLKLVNRLDEALFETPLQTLQGAWPPSSVNAMLEEAFSPSAASSFYQAMASKLTP